MYIKCAIGFALTYGNVSFIFVDHEITADIFYKLESEDLRLLCPVIGQRFRLEQEQKLHRKKTPTSPTMSKTVNLDLETKVSLIILFRNIYIIKSR